MFQTRVDLQQASNLEVRKIISPDNISGNLLFYRKTLQYTNYLARGGNQIEGNFDGLIWPIHM